MADPFLGFELGYRTAKLSRVTIELINTGSELLLGSVLNTHHAWISRQLVNLGYLMTRQTTVADEGSVIQQVVRESLGRADLVITTGGLGPTSDDLTRNLIADLLGKKLEADLNVLSQIENYFIARKRVMAASSKVQALVPEGATVLPNLHGTAPGLILEVAPGQFRPGERPSFLVMLPGPPRELHPMFTRSVIPWLQQTFPRRIPFLCRIFKTTGMGESILEETIAPSIKHLVDSGLEIGYCARIGEVEVRVVAHGDQAEEKVDEASQIMTRLLGPYIFGLNDEQLEDVVIRLLSEHRQTLALAESCTGGYISHRLTNIPGASTVFLSGAVTYSNEAKQLFLGVREDTLAKHGAVSEPVAREMAEGVRLRTGSDFGLAVTGIAGPGGGSDEKPVGTVFIALAGNSPTVVLQNFNSFDRETFKYVTSQQALELLRRTLIGQPFVRT
jgi:nicotinamide-nucleotide amidase